MYCSWPKKRMNGRHNRCVKTAQYFLALCRKWLFKTTYPFCGRSTNCFAGFFRERAAFCEQEKNPESNLFLHFPVSPPPPVTKRRVPHQNRRRATQKKPTNPAFPLITIPLFMTRQIKRPPHSLSRFVRSPTEGPTQ